MSCSSCQHSYSALFSWATEIISSLRGAFKHRPRCYFDILPFPWHHNPGDLLKRWAEPSLCFWGKDATGIIPWSAGKCVFETVRWGVCPCVSTCVCVCVCLWTSYSLCYIFEWSFKVELRRKPLILEASREFLSFPFTGPLQFFLTFSWGTCLLKISYVLKLS